ncbi:hypothetical protein BH10BAC2_BH10BAC2_09280 [soil metagenome]
MLLLYAVTLCDRIQFLILFINEALSSAALYSSVQECDATKA